ncbi:MAG: hypothetical protein EA424_01230 [Planctomycetaceae bacterium]|nr:MAG: hypothetical protein EA424_01230 [Planctomycetaceae bacterium]
MEDAAHTDASRIETKPEVTGAERDVPPLPEGVLGPIGALHFVDTADLVRKAMGAERYDPTPGKESEQLQVLVDGLYEIVAPLLVESLPHLESLPDADEAAELGVLLVAMCRGHLKDNADWKSPDAARLAEWLEREDADPVVSIVAAVVCAWMFMVVIDRLMAHVDEAADEADTMAALRVHAGAMPIIQSIRLTLGESASLDETVRRLIQYPPAHLGVVLSQLDHECNSVSGDASPRVGSGATTPRAASEGARTDASTPLEDPIMRLLMQTRLGSASPLGALETATPSHTFLSPSHGPNGTFEDASQAGDELHRASSLRIRDAKWFRTQTDYTLYPNLLRSAQREGRLWAEKRGGRWYYRVDEVAALYPKCGAALLTALERENSPDSAGG